MATATKPEVIIHPACKILPMVDDKEYKKIKTSIAAMQGLREKIKYIVDDQGRWVILAGRTRHKILNELKIFDPAKHMELAKFKPGQSLIQFVIDSDLMRRHMTPSQRNAVGTELEELLVKESAKRQKEGQQAGGKARWEEKNGTHEGNGKATPSKGPKKAATKGDESRTSRGQAAAMVGGSPRGITDAKMVKKHSPELAEAVKKGELTLNQAKKRVLADQRKAEMEKVAAAAAEKEQEFDSLVTLHVGDVVEQLRPIEAESADLAIADPPYNQGVNYGSGAAADKLDPIAYADWCLEWIEQCFRILKPNGSMFLISGKEHADLIAMKLRKAGFHRRAWITWYETFGQNMNSNFNATSRFIFYLVKNAKKFTFNPEAVKRFSKRQEMGDKRANPDGKLWDDVWMIPRLVGTAKERMPDFPTQLPEALVKPLVEVASKPGDTVLDLFSGSGTGLVCALTAEHGARTVIGFEKSKKYAEAAMVRAKATFAKLQ